MLRNSDFYTGAFPAEYGNATSGVFDIKMRTGNSRKREHTLQLSMLGMDVSSEGPFKAGSEATYLFNYRYSTLGLVGTLMSLPNLPKYQDLSFKFDFPTQQYGTFTFWGLGAIDVNEKAEEMDSLKWENDISRNRMNYHNSFGTVGLSHRLTLGSKTFLHSTLSADAMSYGMDKQELTTGLQLLPTDFIESTEGKYSLRTVLNHKFSQRLSSRTGVTVSRMFFENTLKKAFRETPQELTTFVDNDGFAMMTQAFSQFRIEVSPRLTANLGFHSMYLDVNKKATLEPRAGLAWNVTQNDELSMGYGLHAQMEELRTYHSQTLINGEILTPNKDLGFLKSHHFVLGYGRRINDVVRMKVEPYYQYLTDVPVVPGTSFAIINITSDWAINRKLENTGTATNYGIDVTLERFLKDGYFWLLTSSVFDARYTGGDGVEYKSRHNRGYVVNALAGKEFMLNNRNVLGISARVTYMGGLRYTPALYEESLAARMYKPDYSKTHEGQFPSTACVDLSITYRMNRNAFSGVWSLMVKNALLQPDYSDPFYDFISKDVIIDQMRMPIPSLGYKIEF
jgi:hypothetical protein